jgi:hypothetical protein
LPAAPHARHGGRLALTAAEISRLFDGLVIGPLRGQGQITAMRRHRRRPTRASRPAAENRRSLSR